MSGSEAEPGWGDAARAMCGIIADAPWVAGLRLARLGRGGPAAREELALMVAEKLVAHAAVAKALASGKLGRSPGQIAANTLGFYALWVGDNRKRLGRGA